MEVKGLVAQSCLTLQPHGHAILQSRILEWVAISFSRRSSRPRDWTWVSCIADRFFTVWANNLHEITQWAKAEPAWRTRAQPLCRLGASLVAQLVKNSPAVQCNGSIPGSGRSSGEGIGYPLHYSWASLVAQTGKNLPAMQQTWVWSLGWEDLLGKGTATTPVFWPGEFHGQRSLVDYIQYVGSQRVGHDWVTLTFMPYVALLPINHSCWLGKELQLWAKSFLSTPPHNTLPPALVTYKYFLKRIVYVTICEMPVPLP